MPIRTDDTGKRWIELELLLPGTPEQVWHAMATGAGNSAWFTRTEIEERAGGALRFDFGPNGSSSGEVVTWQPPLRFGYVERDWSEGAPPVATEITITARSGDRCVVRMVHSLFTTSDQWDDQVEGFETGWPGFFQVLRSYLLHFQGRRAASFMVVSSSKTDQSTLWARLTSALNLAGANLGDQRAAPADSPGLSGTVEHISQDAKQRYLVLRADAPTPAIALIGTCGFGDTTNASIAFYLYGDEADAQAEETRLRWDAWLRDAMAEPEG